MLFNSFEFFLFLPVVFVLYWFVFQHKVRAQNLLILLASYFFYGWWSWKFMAMLMLSTALDYAYGFWVASPDRKKAKVFLWLSIINNLGILGVFKYYNFFQFNSSKDLNYSVFTVPQPCSTSHFLSAFLFTLSTGCPAVFLRLSSHDV
jgi:alginate O-acetyltransferase complex protein AlgI